MLWKTSPSGDTRQNYVVYSQSKTCLFLATYNKSPILASNGMFTMEFSQCSHWLIFIVWTSFKNNCQVSVNSVFRQTNTSFVPVHGSYGDSDGQVV